MIASTFLMISLSTFLASNTSVVASTVIVSPAANASLNFCFVSAETAVVVFTLAITSLSVFVKVCDVLLFTSIVVSFPVLAGGVGRLGCAVVYTCTSQIASLPSAFAVIFTFPFATGVTTPSFTVATDVLLEIHSISPSIASTRFANKVLVVPIATPTFVSVNVIAGTFALTTLRPLSVTILYSLATVAPNAPL